MAEATVIQEPYGIRLQCVCGAEQFYATVDDVIYLCHGCRAQYQMMRMSEDIRVVLVERR
jgi:hypothetical protein